MKITKITLNNFKAFQGEHVIDTDSSVVCLVGENNTGKTTIFAAIDFLKNGIPKEKSVEDYKNKSQVTGEVSVEIVIKGELKKAIEDFSESKFLPYVDEQDGVEMIRIKRSSEKLEITQNNKPVQLDEKKITIFNPESKQFENPAGFDKAISSLFEAQFVWSDMKATDVVDFGSTKILGKLLKEVSDGFQKSQEWLDFQAAHQKAFITSENALSKQSKKIVDDIQDSLSDFYGQAKIQFSFQAPDSLSFIKLGDVFVDDGVNTSITEKGSGMQRALALSVIKVYSDFLMRHKDNHELAKPFFFFIDEPEISLHPRAQSILVNALSEIAKRQQIFITTHSSHFLKSIGVQENAVHITFKNDGVSRIKSADKINTFNFSPTLAEINYFAYAVATPDFHNELYGYVSEVIKKFTSSQFDCWMDKEIYIPKNKKWTSIKKGVHQTPDEVSLMTYIRHSIHHPENKLNQAFTDAELEQSIEYMLSVIQSDAFLVLKSAEP